MYYTQVIALLTAVATASPVVVQRERSAPYQMAPRDTYLANDTLTACEAAPNCETYEDPIFGTRIKFVDGMGPGSEHYKRNVQSAVLSNKRDGEAVTRVTVGDGKLNYGAVKASGTGGAIHHLYDTCHEGSCNTNAYAVASTFAGETSQYEDTLYLHASGQYNGWDERNVFVEAIVNVASKGEECWEQTWSNGGGYGQSVKMGKVTMCKQTNYIGINRFLNGNLQGFMEVRVERKDTESGFCGNAFDFLAGITGIIGAIPGASVAGGASGFFGIVKLFCQ